MMPVSIPAERVLQDVPPEFQERTRGCRRLGDAPRGVSTLGGTLLALLGKSGPSDDQRDCIEDNCPRGVLAMDQGLDRAASG
jgi:hypothetical protein